MNNFVRTYAAFSVLDLVFARFEALLSNCLEYQVDHKARRCGDIEADRSRGFLLCRRPPRAGLQYRKHRPRQPVSEGTGTELGYLFRRYS
jgi:hypothetical protein